jgi:hypothetical protein
MDQDRFTNFLYRLSARWPRYKLTEYTIMAYTMDLAHIPIELLEVAERQCATKYTFFPAVHEILAEVAELQRKQNAVPTAYEAWEDLVKGRRGKWKECIEENGQWFIEEREYKFIHPLVTRVAEMLGWPDGFPTDNPVADRAHYFKAYEQTLSDLVNDQMMHPEVRQFLEDKHNGRQITGSTTVGQIADRVREQARNG